MRKPILILLTGIIAGTLMTSPVLASTGLFQVALSQVKLMINGSDKTPANGTYWNGNTDVPFAFQYEGTTYLPVRYISESLGIPIDWDGSTRTIFVGNKPSGGSLTLSFGQAEQPDTEIPVTFTPMNAVLYDADDTQLIKVNVAVRNDDTKPFQFNLYQSRFVTGDGAQFTGNLYILQNTGEYEIPAKTTQVVQYYANVPKKVTGSDLSLVLSKADFSTYPAQFKTWASIPLQMPAATDPGYLGGHLPVTLDLYPYKLQVNRALLWNFEYQAQKQEYKLNVTTSKDGDVNAFPNSVDLIFELLDGNGQTMAETRYALGSSANSDIPVLDDGDQYITFKNIVWSRFNGSGMKMRVWEAFDSGKRLIGTF